MNQNNKKTLEIKPNRTNIIGIRLAHIYKRIQESWMLLEKISKP